MGLGLVNGVGLGLVNGVGLGLEVVEPCRSRPGGVGLGLEVVEPCRIWVFFFLFNFLVLKLWNLTLCGDFVLRN